MDASAGAALMSLQSDFTLSDDFPPVDYETWRAAVEESLKGVPFEKRLVTHTYEGFEIPPVYRREDWNASGDPSGFPGMAPFTRGATLLGNVGSGWDKRQEHAQPDPADTNAAILTDLERGVTSILIRLDAAARTGLDPDMPPATTLVAHDGVAVYDVDGLARALAGVRLDIAGVALQAGAAVVPAAALLVALARREQVDLDEVRFSFDGDPLAVLARDGSLPVPVDTALRDLADLAQWTDQHLPQSTSVRVGTHPYHSAGATTAQDLGYSMATGIRYLRALTGAGMPLDRAARQMVFSYSIGTNFFHAIAKLRAARLLWARVLEACGADDDTVGMTLHVRPSRRVLTIRDPWVNMLRNTVCCFAGAVAGASAITVAPFDAAIGPPNDLSRRVARNTQIILEEESHLARVIDPAGGSWMIERQTEQLAELAWSVLQQVEAAGGMDAALTSGWVAERIDAAAAPRMHNIALRKDPITGVSEFPNVLEQAVVREEPDHATMRQQAVAALSRVDDTAGAGLDDLPPRDGSTTAALIGAAGEGASIGQLARALWTDGGEAPSIDPLTPQPYAEPFEALRDHSDRFLGQTGHRPAVFLANMGPLAHHTARATYAKNFFEAGGFGVLTNEGFADADAAAQAFASSGANIAVICSSDKLYETMVPDVAPALKDAGARTVVLAGRPGDNEAAYREAGVDRFIYIRCNVLQTLRELLTEEGVLRDDS
jgi:methylmalonyl-CoA mutase